MSGAEILTADDLTRAIDRQSNFLEASTGVIDELREAVSDKDEGKLRELLSGVEVVLRDLKPVARAMAVKGIRDRVSGRTLSLGEQLEDAYNRSFCKFCVELTEIHRDLRRSLTE